MNVFTRQESPNDFPARAAGAGVPAKSGLSVFLRFRNEACSRTRQHDNAHSLSRVYTGGTSSRDFDSVTHVDSGVVTSNDLVCCICGSVHDAIQTHQHPVTPADCRTVFARGSCEVTSADESASWPSTSQSSSVAQAPSTAALFPPHITFDPTEIISTVVRTSTTPTRR